MDWTDPAAKVARHVNGLSPFPGAWTMHEGKRLKLLRARAAEGEDVPGAVLRGEALRVACGTGAVDIIEVQPEGRGRMTAADWRRGARLAAGDRLAD